MSYNPTTDFVALLRNVSGERLVSIPGLDFVVSALARAGLINLSVGQTPPIANQPTTVWFKPSVPSWVAEGQTYLWNPVIAQYQLATPALWSIFFSGSNSGYLFQSATLASNAVNAGTTLVGIQRTAPSATAIVLPALASQFLSARKLQIVDFSTSVTLHTITLTTTDGSTIMQKASFALLSTPDQLAGVTLQPSPDLNSWVVAP